MRKRLFTILTFVLLLSSCSILQTSPKQELTDGFYLKKIRNERQQVYIDVMDDSIQIYPTTSHNKTIAIDTLKPFELYSSEFKTKVDLDFTLYRNSLDIDFLTIPSKFRFAENEVPPQLNSELNGVIYIGFRRDHYRIEYQKNPLKKYERRTIHFGYSVGLFTGFGNTFMSPTNTNDILQQEYDGIVWSKGLAGIIGVNNLSIGIAIGFDNLLDENKNIWIYENKPWIGLGFGLNLN